jgi:hypothetical protein
MAKGDDVGATLAFQSSPDPEAGRKTYPLVALDAVAAVPILARPGGRAQAAIVTSLVEGYREPICAVPRNIRSAEPSADNYDLCIVLVLQLL